LLAVAAGAPRIRRGSARSTHPRRWSQHVTETSHALDLEPDVFKLTSPRAVAESLKRSADRSSARRADPFRSAMSMLIFYINRAGKNLSPERRVTLEKAKDELRALFGRARAPRRPSGKPSRSHDRAR
jgi:Protein of unknown function (DUF3175)